MRRSGRANILVVVAIVLIVGVVGLIITAGRGPLGIAGDFMTALATQNVEQLADLSVIGSDDRATRVAKWRKTFERSKHYAFIYKLQEATETSDKSATVRLTVIQNINQPSMFEQKFELSLVKTDAGWKVDVPSMSRDMFPALPR